MRKRGRPHLLQAVAPWSLFTGRPIGLNRRMQADTVEGYILRYLAAKKTVDDRALNGFVWRRLKDNLARRTLIDGFENNDVPKGHWRCS